MAKIDIDVKDLEALRLLAIRNGTLEQWSRVAMEWVRDADKWIQNSVPKEADKKGE
jgi:hypothetical protein